MNDRRQTIINQATRSPIERTIAISLVEEIDDLGDAVCLVGSSARRGFEAFIDGSPASITTRNITGLLDFQVVVGRNRVDLWVCLIRRAGGILCKSNPVIVECDGHEWHERTAEQAGRDKGRDRELAAEGYIVLRFTGREIVSDPRDCAIEILWIIFKRSGWLGVEQP